ncbi:cytochrome b/b6 domain-containing protein [Ramlibacter sp. PS3R-8]|uniref:cytochrome b/b6 domain-containing protein n=1 Tax=Ramlibacter sp. PS3R-8 TaxID=3133437 RepID=UPI0030AC1616
MPIAVNNAGYGVLVPLAPPSTAQPEARSAAGGLVRVRVWDLPTRTFHWALAASLAGLAATGYAGGAWMEWHARLGSVTLALLLFRIVWGFIGGKWSRFASFLPTPGRVLAYLREQDDPRQHAGHNPLGALSVLAMLAVVMAQLLTGMAGDDGGGFTGPLNDRVSQAVGAIANVLHKQIGQWLLLALVLLHVAAIAFYRIVRRQKLVQAMVDGDRLLPARASVPASRDDAVTRAKAFAVLCACAALVGWLVGY